MASSAGGRPGCSMAELAEVEIDSDGTFKYILVRVQQRGSGQGGQSHGHQGHDGGRPECRDLVRGTASAECHTNIFEKMCPEMEALGLICKCLGGGKIEHNSKDKKIHVSGVSAGYGKADHSTTVQILKKKYKDYDISCSDDM